MKAMSFTLVLSLTFSFLQAARADIVCSVSGTDPQNPNRYVRELHSVHLNSKAPALEATRYLLVDQGASKATEITRDEFRRRRDQHDLKDYDGQLLVGFTPDGEQDSSIVVEEIDSTREKGVKGGSTSYGNVETRPLFVVLGDHSLAAGCLLN